MTDYVFSAPDYETLFTEAIRLGFTYTDMDGGKQIIFNGPMVSGGSYFLNLVGLIDGTNGFWGRLRANGNLSDIPPFSSSITQFVFSDQLNNWIDCSTGKPAPDYVQNIGVIA